MKTKNWLTLALILVTLLICRPLWSQEWSTPIFISGGSCPDMDVDARTGQVYVLSMVNGVTISRVAATGEILEQEIVPGTIRDQGGKNFGATIAVDSRGFPHICYRYYDGDDADGTPTYTAYYVKKTAAGWLEPLLLAKYVRRGYMIRLDVDERDVVHIVQGFTFDEAESIWGYVRYFRVIDNVIEKQQVLGRDFPYIFRGDDRIEIIAQASGLIYLLTGVPDPNGKIYYLLSRDRGNTFVSVGDIHSTLCTDRNGSPDLTADSTGLVHLCYGATKDDSRHDQPSVRYARFNQTARIRDQAVTPENLLTDWKIGMGLGSIASDDSGRIVMVAFSEKPGGKLYTTYSNDRGENWNSPVQVASSSGGDEGRNKHLLRSWNNRFFLVYPENNNIYLRHAAVTLDRPPVANAGGPYTASEGAIIHFEASQSYDPDGTIVKYEWDWQNDGSFDATSTASLYDHVYPDDFQGQVKLRVTDDAGNTSTSLANVTVLNVPPVANANGPYHGAINQMIQCYGTATDAGKNDTLTFAWDLDFNGSFETMGQDVLVHFSRGGSYHIVLRVADADGGVGLDTALVNISSQSPVVSFIPAQTILEGAAFAPIHLDDYVHDPDNTDDQITWQVRGGNALAVIIDAARIALIAPRDKDWFGIENLTFIAIDPGQMKDSTIASFTITNVNDAPVIAAIPDQVTTEGMNFEPLVLDNFVHDVDNRPADISWTVTGQIQLQVRISQRVLSAIPMNSEWSGREALTLVATDPGGLSDTSRVIFIVQGVNDPPIITPIPDQQKRVGQDFDPIVLDDYVSDPDNRDDEITWTFRNNKRVKVAVASRIATVSRLDPNWVGADTLLVIATDPSGGADSARVIFTSLKRNEPPTITRIPDQTILEGQQFQPIYLDAYVTDPDHKDEEIEWKISGYKRLLIQVSNRVVTVQAPSEEWNGSEIINFKAMDPEGLADSSSTRFTVQFVNDPPVLAQLPDFQINEDDTLKWSYEYLRSLVTDPDNRSDDFRFTISHNVHLLWQDDSRKQQLRLWGPSNWSGEESITLTVADGRGGSDSRRCKITIIPIPDLPALFSIIYPNGTIFSATGDTIRFRWQKSHDPEGGRIMYQLNIAEDRGFIHVIDQYNNLLDTCFVYVTQSPLSTGVYYWNAVAFNRYGFTKSNTGHFSIIKTGIPATGSDVVPKELTLFQNYPNPFNPETQIVYQLPQQSKITLAIYNTLGQQVQLLEAREKQAGTHKITWRAITADGKKLPSGLYICRLKVNEQWLEMKMVLLQ